MKKIIPLFLIACLLLSACVIARAENTGVAEPLSLYPAALQTPLDMPVVLDAETYPAGRTLVWASSNPSVATVDAEGCVTPVSVGETIVTCALAGDASVMAACGVLVVAEGKILLWEYPPEPVDWDALLAYETARDAEQAANDPGIPWPDLWPDDLPKLEGKVSFSYGETPESAEGLSVFLNVQGLDAARAYVSELAALGLKAKEMPGSDYYVILSGKGYEIYVMYTDSSKECTVFLKK